MVSSSNFTSLLFLYYKHIFYILKKYSENNLGLVLSIYFVLVNFDESKPEYILNIKMRNIVSLKSDEDFLS